MERAKAKPTTDAPARTHLYYDSDCGFCRWALGWILRWDRRERLAPLAIQSAEGEHELGDLGEARLASWHLVRRGERHSGGRAIPPLLEELPGGRALAPLARRLEFALVPGYRWIAAHRNALSRLVPARSKARANALLAARVSRPDPKPGHAGRLDFRSPEHGSTRRGEH